MRTVAIVLFVSIPGLIENQKADEIMNTVTSLMKSFKMRPYNEDTGYGFLRHILVRTGYHTGQIMVVLVTASPVFPSKNNFVKALRKEHPEITTIIANVNNRNTSMVLGDKSRFFMEKGYIEDVLCWQDIPHFSEVILSGKSNSDRSSL